MAKTKSFKTENPAEMFISTAQTSNADAEEKMSSGNNAEPEEKHCHYVPIEKRDRRVQLMLTQSLYDQARDIANEKGISFNEFVSEVLEEAVNRS